MATPHDFLIARKVVAKALEQLSETESTTENQIVQDISKEGNPILRLRFFDEGYQIVEALYDPVMAAVGFLNRAQEFWQNRLPEDAPDHDEIVFESAVNMLVWMLSKMHLRLWIAMGDLGDETWHDWAGRQCAFEAKEYRAQGIKVDYKVSASETTLKRPTKANPRTLGMEKGW